MDENYKAGSLSLTATVAMGTGVMIGAGIFALTGQVAELAGKDPIDFRLELFERAKNNPVGEEFDYDAERYAGVLKLIKEKANWGENVPGVHRGVAAYFCHNWLFP